VRAACRNRQRKSHEPDSPAEYIWAAKTDPLLVAAEVLWIWKYRYAAI
jgi:hypothetical protein